MSKLKFRAAMLSMLALALAACSSSSTTSASAPSGGAVVGVAIPSSVSVVTANNANGAN